MHNQSQDYTPRHPETSLLYRVIAEQRETLLASWKPENTVHPYECLDRFVPGK